MCRKYPLYGICGILTKKDAERLRIYMEIKQITENRGNYLFQGKLTNTVHDVTEDQLDKLRKEYLKKVRENCKVTNSSVENLKYIQNLRLHS